MIRHVNQGLSVEVTLLLTIVCWLVLTFLHLQQNLYSLRNVPTAAVTCDGQTDRLNLVAA